MTLESTAINSAGSVQDAPSNSSSPGISRDDNVRTIANTKNTVLQPQQNDELVELMKDQNQLLRVLLIIMVFFVFIKILERN